MVKYAGLSSQAEFVPIAVETTGDVRASSFLFQRISVVVQRFSSFLLHDGFIDDDRPE